MLLKTSDSWGPNLGLVVLGLLLAVTALLTLFGVSIAWLFKRATRKRGLIGLGVFLLVVGVVALSIVL